ncbi:hypothetical protein F5Y11DRAFT_350085 [Daldinia sp. FL1419]|nr:hypothetical protein F5Y11DRAFT_350085 [Daldinia sp. FL1419]
MAAKELDEVAEAREAGPGHSLRSTRPRWHDDGRVSLIMRAFEDAQQYQRTGRSLDSTAAAAAQGTNDSKSSVGRIRQEIDAAVVLGVPERLKTMDFVSGAIATAMAELMFVEVSNINSARSVVEHGVDSLIMVELRNWFYQALGAKITTQELLDAKMSITALAGVIVDAALTRAKGE